MWGTLYISLGHPAVTAPHYMHHNVQRDKKLRTKLRHSTENLTANDERKSAIHMNMDSLTRPKHRSLSLAIFIAVGLGFGWNCAFEWFAGKNSLWSVPVLTLGVLVVLLCAIIGSIYGLCCRHED